MEYSFEKILTNIGQNTAPCWWMVLYSTVLYCTVQQVSGSKL